MRTIISKLFSRSPFSPLQFHMSKVADCVRKLEELFSALGSNNYDEVKKISKLISKLEHDADLAKADIRNNLSVGIFLPVDKGTLLDILALQDNIADKCEDISVVLTMKKLELSDTFKNEFQQFLQKNIECFHVAERIIEELDELLETSFAGFKAEKVIKMIDDVAFKEHEADVLQSQLLRRLFELENEIPYGSFILWLKIFDSLGDLANISENVGNRIRTILDIK